MLAEFGHKALAETHHLRIRFAVRVKVASTLASAHREGCKTVLECLLESEELQNAQVYAAVEAQATLVRAECAVHLHAISLVDVNLAKIVGPGNSEHDDAFRLNHPLKDFKVNKIGIFCDIRGHTLDNFPHRLVELRLSRVAGNEFIHKVIDKLSGELVHKE